MQRIRHSSSSCALVCLILLIGWTWSEASAQTVSATGYTKVTNFTSPTVVCGDNVSNCRFSEFTGVWLMPDGSLMEAFIVATGPASPAQGRTFMSESTLHLFGYTENGTTGFKAWEKGYDFYGLNGGCPASPTLPTATQKCQEIVYRQSFDGGSNWSVWRTDPFQALYPAPYFPQATIALPNGTLMRRVNGDDLKDQTTIPHTAMLQALKTTDTNWPALGGTGQVVTTAADPNICKYQISRIRALGDGRYIALGQEWKYASGGTSGACAASADSNLVLVAASYSDVETGNWSIGMPYVSSTTVTPGEWDAAPIAGGSGDLLALFGGAGARKQARLRAKTGANCPSPTNGSIGCWVLDATTLGNPGSLQHSGHPELLATQEGMIIEFATDRVAYTTDGTAWTTLSGFTGGVTNYYPRALQDPNSGYIYVFSHVGCDDPYAGYASGWGGRSYTGTPMGTGCWQGSGVNQSITMQKFQLSVSGLAPAVTTTAATGVTSTTATLNGTVNPNGQSTTYHFQYGLTTSYGSNTTTQSAGSGTTSTPVNAGISGLSPSTTYHFRLVATNASGTTNGTDQVLTTSASGGTSYYQSVLNSSPVSYWRLGEASGTAAADQMGVNPGTYTGGVTLGATGAVPSNTAASFDGVNDYVLAADSVSLDTGDVFTVEAWIKPSQLGVTNVIVNKFGSYFFYLDGTNKLVLYKPNVGSIVTSTTAIADTTNYHHVVVTKNGATAKIYLDGADVSGTLVNRTVANSTGALYIGYLSGGAFHGVIDEVAIYNTALTAGTVSAHFAARNN